VSPAHPVHTAEQALERLARLPGGPELLSQARRREDVALVGGAVRDLLLGHWPRELDVTVAADAVGLARELAASVSPSERAYGHAVTPIEHERFGTASVQWEYGRIDIAERRAERYPAPGALPEVAPGSVEEDLARRDFTVNAISLALGGRESGRVSAVEDAREDLASGLLRVLHERSFIDDPTRVLRLARYQARLGFAIEAHTEELAHAAIAGGALDTVSRARVGAELRLALEEPDPLAALHALEDLGVLAALDRTMRVDRELAERTLALLPADADRGLALLAASLLGGADARVAERRNELFALLDGLEFTAGERERVIVAASRARELAGEMERAAQPSRLHEALAGVAPEAVALAGAVAGEGSAAERAAESWLRTLRAVRLSIDGADLLAAGVPEGPEIGRRLAAALAARLDGELDGGREAELAAALGEDA
jgi:tRNA nucleotidyltransferase (CCA-adding enzyme)